MPTTQTNTPPTTGAVIFGMNIEQIKSMIWKVAAFVGGVLVTLGYVQSFDITSFITKWEPIVGAIISLYVMYRSYAANTQAGLVAATVNVMPKVEEIKIDDKATVNAIKKSDPEAPVVAAKK
jgi:D-tyrosyl-tRNA(Tyr) deacylase